MPQTPPNRIPPTYGAIEGALRSNILKGKWAPGQQLPTHNQLLKKFATSNTTLQRALDRLVADGFVEGRRGCARFVSARPPHLSEYGLVFHGTPEYPASWGRFWQVLSSSAKVFERTGERKFPQFYGIHDRTDVEDYQNLLRRLRSRRLAGLIFAANPHAQAGDLILEEPDIPRVALMSPNPRLPTPSVTVDNAALCDRAVNYLADRGRKRIAALFYAGTDEGHAFEDHFLAAMQSRGLEQKPHWRQYVNVFHQTTVCRVVQLLLHTDQTQRPDALLVSDDTMVDAVVNGLFAAGVNVPQDVEVVAHANFPVSSTAMPIKRLGYDSRVLLQTCIRLIDQQRRGEPVPLSTFVRPLFEEEIEEMVVT